MIVENKWLAGIVSIPSYLVTFLSLLLVTRNVFTYIIFSIFVLYFAGIVYQNIVVIRVKTGVSQSVELVQWLAAQLFMFREINV